MVSNSILYVTLRLTSAVLPFVPLTLAYRMADFAGSVAYHLAVPARDAIRENLAVVVGGAASDPQVRALAKAAFQNDARNWIDTLRIGRVSREELQKRVAVDGWENLHEALRTGKGAILLGIHLGNFDTVGQLLLARGYQLTVPVEHMKPERLFTLLTAGRRSLGMNIVPVDRAARELPRALRAGQLVGVMGDRYLTGKPVQATFFGRPAALPRAHVALARSSGAPILLAYALRLPSGAFHGFIAPPLWIDRETDDIEAVRRLTPLMERAIRREPGQWLAFRPVWTREPAHGQADTIGQRKGAAV